MAKTANAQGHGLVLNPRGKTNACVGAVVVTFNLKFEAVTALTDSVAGTEQVASAGAPVQLSEAVPLMPPPPIESVYVAFEPADTFAELELPEAKPSARVRLVPVPESVTDCGLSGALSVKLSVPVAAPATVGVKVTLSIQDDPGPRDVPQALVSPNRRLAWMWENCKDRVPELVKVIV
jgi:hypothetical protein